MSQAPPIVATLIDRFEQNRESYKSQGYNETQVRREFLDPFFKALGWDVENKQGHAEAYKESSTKMPSRSAAYTKAPDYCFRIGGTRKFFLEAKKPAVNMKDELSPAYQLRRYAWSAKLPLSILTDFEEFAVYDCRIKPEPTDKASAGRIFYLTYREYLTRWDEIAAIFPKDAVLKGSFDKYADTDQQARHGHRRCCVPEGDRNLARSAGQEPGAAKPQALRPRTELCRAAHHRPDHLPAHLRRPRHRTLRASFKRSSTARTSMGGFARSTNRPTTDTTPACFTSTPKRIGPNRPTTSRPG